MSSSDTRAPGGGSAPAFKPRDSVVVRSADAKRIFFATYVRDAAHDDLYPHDEGASGERRSRVRFVRTGAESVVRTEYVSLYVPVFEPGDQVDFRLSALGGTSRTWQLGTVHADDKTSEHVLVKLPHSERIVPVPRTQLVLKSLHDLGEVPAHLAPR